MLVPIVHPCGHSSLVDQRALYDGTEGPCPHCEEARAAVRELCRGYLDPLRTYLDQIGAIVWPDDDDDFYGQDMRWQGCRDRAVAALEVAVPAIIDGLVQRTTDLDPTDHVPTLDTLALVSTVTTLLRELQAAQHRTHSALWCGENGLSLMDGQQAFWLFDVENAERVLEEMAQSLPRHLSTPPPPTLHPTDEEPRA